MKTNSELTVYHKGFNEETKLETWTRRNYLLVWWFGGKGSRINKGYDEANDVDIRIPYKQNQVNIQDFSIGDIIVKGNLTADITTQQDLEDYDVYNITSINDNNFGNTPHIHLGGK
jgi:hypothetical protein